MSKLLYVKASPRSGSRSVAVADAYLSALRTKMPDLSVDTLALWDEYLPDFDGDRAAAKMNVLSGERNTTAQQTAWEEIVAIAGRFTAADHYLFAVPMWNNGIPYRLKQYIDIIHQPGILWTFDPANGYSGLLRGKKATLVVTSGAFAQHLPSPAFGVDHQSTYMRTWLNQAGVTDVEEIRYQPTLTTSDPEGDFTRAKLHAAAAAA